MHFSQKQLQNNQRLCHWHCQAQQQHWNSVGFVQHDYLSLSWSFFCIICSALKNRGRILHRYRHDRVETFCCMDDSALKRREVDTSSFGARKPTCKAWAAPTSPISPSSHPLPLSQWLAPKVKMQGHKALWSCPGGCSIHRLKTNPRYYIRRHFLLTQLSMWSIIADVGWISIINRMWTRSK